MQKDVLYLVNIDMLAFDVILTTFDQHISDTIAVTVWTSQMFLM